MLPTITQVSPARKHLRRPARRVSRASLYALDALLFEPASWFALDVSNRRVPGVAPSSLDAALSLVGHGAVATVVGRTRPGVLAVDIDVEGVLGDAIAEMVATWCDQHHVWWLARPSGGAAGRVHVFTAAADEPRLREHVQQIRDRLGVPASAVDVRRSLRPLSAPHRTGSNPGPWGDLDGHLGSFPSLATTRTRHDRPDTARRDGRARRTPVRPQPRRRRELPEDWAAYFRTGVAPHVGGQDHSRSTVEAVATGWLVRTGHTAEQAWDIIVGAHRGAMSKARGSRHRWLGVWNRQVADVEAYERAQEPDPHVAATVASARLYLHTHIGWACPPRQRAAVLLVGHALLDRAYNSDSLRVPCPQRDLVLDTGVTDRSVISRALRFLDGRLGVLHSDTYDPRHPDHSSYEFTVDSSSVVSQPLPPRSHTPVPRGTWGDTLPRGCHGPWRALTLSATPLTLTEVCALACLCTRAGDDPSPRQRRTTRDLLRRLEAAGLAQCTPEGSWTVGPGLTTSLTSRAEQAYAGMADRVDADREAHRAGLRSDWSTARAAALKRDHARQVAWWGSLSEAERASRAAEHRARFDSLSPAAQEDAKAEWAQRRQRAGVDEPERYAEWARSRSRQDWDFVSLRRATEFATYPSPLPQLLVMGWKRHRARFGLASWGGDRRSAAPPSG